MVTAAARILNILDRPIKLSLPLMLVVHVMPFFTDSVSIWSETCNIQKLLGTPSQRVYTKSEK